MPVATQGKVLVTGANGYIAFWVVKGLLEAGYEVRGTVRSASKAKYVQDYFKQYGDKLEVVVVDDITKVRRLQAIDLLCTEIDSTSVASGSPIGPKAAVN